MRFLLLALVLVLAACPGPRAPAGTPVDAAALFAGTAQVRVPDGPDVALEMRGEQVIVVASGAIARTELVAIPPVAGATYALVVVKDSIVVARLADGALYVWCYRWQPAKHAFHLMATYDGAVEDEQPYWLPEEIGAFEGGGDEDEPAEPAPADAAVIERDGACWAAGDVKASCPATIVPPDPASIAHGTQSISFDPHTFKCTTDGRVEPCPDALLPRLADGVAPTRQNGDDCALGNTRVACP
jgi:hypothetical protein